MSPMYCRCREHELCSSAVCINPQQMVGICFHPQDSQVQVYWIWLHVKQTVSCTKESQLSYSLSFLTRSWIVGAFPAHCHLAVGVWRQQVSWKISPHGLCAPDFTLVSGCQIIIDNQPAQLISSDSGYLLPCVSISFETLQGFPWGKLFLPKTETPVFFPVHLSMTLSLERDPSCWASLPSNSWPLAPISQHWSKQLRISSPGSQQKSFYISCSSLRHRDLVISVSFMIPVSSSSCSGDCTAAEQAASSDYFSTSLS